MKGCGYVLALALIFSLGTINRGAYHELIYIWVGAAILMTLMLVLERRAQKIADQEYEEAQKKEAEVQTAEPVQAPEKAVIDSYAFEKDTEIIREPKEMYSKDRDEFFCPDGPNAFLHLDELRKKKIETVSLNGVNAGWITDLSRLFVGFENVKQIDMTGFSSSEATSMQNMFHKCEKLVSVDFTGFDTSKVTDMSCMFNRCASLLSLDLTGFDTSKVRRMDRMFDSCGLLTELDLSSFDTRNVETMKEMFKNCTNLTRLDLSGFDFSNVNELENMFSGCDGLKEAVLSDTVLKCMGERETGRTITKYEPRSENEMEPVYAYGAQSRSQVHAYSDPYKTVTEKEVEKVPFSKLTEMEKKKWLGLSEKACLTIVRHAKPASSGSPVSCAPEEKKQETQHKAPEQKAGNEKFEIKDRVLIKYKGAESHVTVPEGVERIRQNAFTAIEKFMEWVGRPGDEGVVTFEEERPLKFIHEIDLPDSVTVIEEGALAQCENLERIRFGKNIREIKAFEFSRCTKLKQVVVSEETRIDERAFRKETEIIRAPKEVHNKCSNDGKGKTAGDFDVRTGVLVKYKGNESHVTVPDGVVAIGNKAFTVTERVKKHREALAPMLAEWSNREYETIEYWEDETVSNHNLKKITLPDSVLEIESYAFYKCSALESIEFGKNICRIGRAAFQGCSNLKRVNVPDKAVIENYAFEKDTEIIRVPK